MQNFKMIVQIAVLLLPLVIAAEQCAFLNKEQFEKWQGLQRLSRSAVANEPEANSANEETRKLEHGDIHKILSQPTTKPEAIVMDATASLWGHAVTRIQPASSTRTLRSDEVRSFLGKLVGVKESNTERSTASNLAKAVSGGPSSRPNSCTTRYCPVTQCSCTSCCPRHPCCTTSCCPKLPCCMTCCPKQGCCPTRPPCCTTTCPRLPCCTTCCPRLPCCFSCCPRIPCCTTCCPRQLKNAAALSSSTPGRNLAEVSGQTGSSKSGTGTNTLLASSARFATETVYTSPLVSASEEIHNVLFDWSIQGATSVPTPEQGQTAVVKSTISPIRPIPRTYDKLNVHYDYQRGGSNNGFTTPRQSYKTSLV